MVSFSSRKKELKCCYELSAATLPADVEWTKLLPSLAEPTALAQTNKPPKILLSVHMVSKTNKNTCTDSHFPPDRNTYGRCGAAQECSVHRPPRCRITPPVGKTQKRQRHWGFTALLSLQRERNGNLGPHVRCRMGGITGAEIAPAAGGSRLNTAGRQFIRCHQGSVFTPENMQTGR